MLISVLPVARKHAAVLDSRARANNSLQPTFAAADAAPNAAELGTLAVGEDMKKFLLVLSLASLSQLVLADDCELDQKARIEENIKLKNKYPGSHLAEKNLVLVVPADDGEVRINIGGCVHYGVKIELKRKKTTKDKNKNEEEFMKQILHLAKLYSQGNVDYAKLTNVIENRRWTQPEPPSRLYFFTYDETSTFEVYEREEGEYTIVGFSMYS